VCSAGPLPEDFHVCRRPPRTPDCLLGSVHKNLVTLQDLFSAQRAWDAGRVSCDKGISQQVSLVPLSVANFRVADNPGVGRLGKAYGVDRS
jgi:hypothetical protein